MRQAAAAVCRALLLQVLLLLCARHSSIALRQAPLALRADRVGVLAAVARDGYQLEYAASALRADRGVVLAAVAQQGDALEYAAPALRGDREIVEAAVATTI